MTKNQHIFKSGLIIIIIIITDSFSITANTYYIFVIIVIIIIIIIMLTHSKTILENTVEIELQPVVLDFKNLSQYSSRFK